MRGAKRPGAGLFAALRRCRAALPAGRPAHARDPIRAAITYLSSTYSGVEGGVELSVTGASPFHFVGAATRN